MAWLFLIALWAWFVWLNTGEWQTNPDYNYGWIVPVFAVFFLYRNLKAAEGPEIPSRCSWWVGLLFVLGCAAVICLELVRQTPVTSRILYWSAWIIVTGATCLAVWARGGGPGLRLIAFPCLFMATCVPWPSFLEQFLLNELARGIAQMVGASFMMLGVYCQVRGNLLVFASGIVGIEEACSGLRLFQASLMCSLGLGEFFYLRWHRRIALIALGALVALALNAIRSYGLCWIFLAGGTDAVGRWHDTVGTLTVLALTGALLLFALRWERRRAEKDSGSALDAVRTLGKQLSPRRWPLGLQERFGLVMILAGFVSIHLWFWQAGAGKDRAAEPLLTSEMVTVDRFRIESLSDGEMEVLKPDSSFRVTARRDDETLWGAYYVYKKPSRQPMRLFYHRPDVCLPGAGWEKIAERPAVSTTLRGRPVRFVPMQFRHGLGEAIWVYWAGWMHGDPLDYGAEGYGIATSRHIFDYIRKGIREPSTEVFVFYTRQDPRGEVHDVDALLGMLFGKD